MANVLGEDGANRDAQQAGEGHHNAKLVADGLQGDLVAIGGYAAGCPRAFPHKKKEGYGAILLTG